MVKIFNFLVFIGRFQPIHLGHLHTINIALQKANKVIIIVGSYKADHSITNPWTAKQRINLICKCLSADQRKNIFFIPIRDRQNEKMWVADVLYKVTKITHNNNSIGLIGHYKDLSSYYLQNYFSWPFLETGNYFNINATDFRACYFNNGEIKYEFIHKKIHKWLKKYRDRMPIAKIMRFKGMDSSLRKNDKTSTSPKDFQSIKALF